MVISLNELLFINASVEQSINMLIMSYIDRKEDYICPVNIDVPYKTTDKDDESGRFFLVQAIVEVTVKKQRNWKKFFKVYYDHNPNIRIYNLREKTPEEVADNIDYYTNG